MSGHTIVGTQAVRELHADHTHISQDRRPE